MFVLKFDTFVGIVMPEFEHLVNATLGKYLVNYDHYEPDNSKKVVVTDNPIEALKFDSPMLALQYWQQQYGMRDYDLLPNRPLTAYTVEVVNLEMAVLDYVGDLG